MSDNIPESDDARPRGGEEQKERPENKEATMTKTYKHVYYHEQSGTDVVVGTSNHPASGVAQDAADRIGVPVEELTQITIYEKPEIGDSCRPDDEDWLLVYYHPDTGTDVTVKISGLYQEDHAKSDAADRIGVSESELIQVTKDKIPVILDE